MRSQSTSSAPAAVPAAATRAFPDDHAAARPDAVAYRMAGSGEEVTYARLTDRSRRIARMLHDRGLRHGDCVALVMENGARFFEVAWAAQRSGLRYTAVSTRLTPPEIAHLLEDSASRVVFATPGCADAVRRAVEGRPDPPVLVGTEGPTDGFEDLEALVAGPDAGPPPDEAEGIDLLYSSGTTGRPKGIEDALPLAPLGTAPGVATLIRDRFGFTAEMVYLSPAPLYHSAPLRVNMTVHRTGGTAVVMERFDAREALALIERHRVTHALMVPTMFVRMLKLPDEERAAFDLSSLRCVIHAAAPCPPEVKRRMIDWLGPVVHEYYAATENHMFTAITSEEALERPGSVGRSLLGTPHVLDDDGRELPAGEVGTIWSEGGPPFSYRNDPEKTAASRNARGWATVGDLGHLDQDGYLYISDRRSDLILSGGVNVYPQEAEAVLVTHPKVTDVAVLGIAHDELGEEVRAVVQPADPTGAGPELEAELLAHCRERLAAFKCPRRIDFEAELPRHATGKLYKRLLRERYEAGA